MSVRLKPYPDYKDSRHSWIGVIPSHWDILPNRALFKERIDKGHEDEQMLSVTIKRGVIRQSELLENTSKKDSSNEDKSKYKLVVPGDLAYNKMRAWQGAVGVSPLRGIVSPAYIIQTLRDPHNPEYFHYLFRTPAFATEAERWSYGITSDQWSLRPGDFKQIYSVRPPRPEQDAIVRFLNRFERRFSHLIRAKRRVIELLNEQKNAIIQRAVTRGLNPNVHLKPSGVDWIGEMPTHWEVWQIGHFARVGNGSTPSRGNSAYWTDSGFPWLNSSSVNQEVITASDQFVTDLALKECHLPRLHPGSVLIAITGQGKTRGTAAMLRVEATINQHLAFMTPDGAVVTAEYLQMALTGAYRALRAISDDSGSTKGALTCTGVKQFRVGLPPRPEQAWIVEGVHDQTRQIEIAISRTKRQIDLLREYRTRLIADIVTGKLDVRGVELPDFDSEEVDEPMSDVEDEELEDAGEMVAAGEGADAD